MTTDVSFKKFSVMVLGKMNQMGNWFRKGLARRLLHHLEFNKPYSGPLTFSSDHYTNESVDGSMSILHGDVGELVSQAENIVEDRNNVEICQRDGRYKTLIEVGKELAKRGYTVRDGSWIGHRGFYWLESLDVYKEWTSTFILASPMEDWTYKRRDL